MEGFSADALRIEVAERADPNLIVLDWRGRSSARNPSQILSPFFATILGAAAEKGMGVELDFSRLEHFNSATVAALIHLIQECRDKAIRLSMVYDGSIKWQKLSFEALRIFVKQGGAFQLRST